MHIRIDNVPLVLLTLLAVAASATSAAVPAQSAETSEGLIVDENTLGQRRSARHRAIAEGDGHGRRRGHKPPVFEDFDSDSDGYISREEFVGRHAVRFQQRAAEGRKMQHAGDPGERFSRIDTDQDGRASPTEFTAHQESHRDRRQSKRRAEHSE